MSTAETLDKPIELQRILKQHRERRVAFWNIETGELFSETGPGAQLPPHTPLSQVLDLIAHVAPTARRPRSLYIMGGESAETTPKRSWWGEPATPAHGERRWQYDGYEIAAHAASGGTADAIENAGAYERGDCQIDVRMMALWFPGMRSPRAARDAWLTLRRALQRHFDPSAQLLATPAATGLDLLHRSLPAGVRYPLAPQELRDLLYEISGQGRFEFCVPQERIGERVAGLWWLDARWMYAACVRGLPTGVPTHITYPHGADADEAYEPYKPAWYRVTIQVPHDWRHYGLIAQRTDSGDTVYPAEPGQWLRDIWTSGSELAVALDNGWPVLIHERWIYGTSPLSMRLPDPTRAWIETLRQLRERFAGDTALAGAIRHLVLDTVGMWHRRAGEKLRITPISAYPGQAHARLHHIDRAAKLAYWYEPKPLPTSALPWQRPEWSSMAWQRAKARENRAALRLPPEIIVAYRADALVLCERPEPARWLDDGKPGTFRLKEHIAGPLALPASADALLQLRRDSAKGGE